MKLSERTYQVTIGVLVLFILFLGWLVYRVTPKSPVSEAGTSAETTGMGTTAGSTVGGTAGGSTSAGGSLSATVSSTGGETVTIADQSAANSVAVSSVTLSQPGWVAVRDSSGRTLGAAWFSAGTHTNVSVPLLRATTAGQSYQALLYADNGDHQFDLHADVLITNSDGSVAGTTFKVQ